MQAQEKPSLYDRLGGLYNIATVVDDLIDRVMEKDTKMGNHLETLRARRVDADYMLKALVSRVECGNILKLAEVVLGEADRLK